MAMRRRSRKRLYLVDDCARGWNIREVDLSSGSDFGKSTEPQPLPPTIFRLCGPPGFPRCFASAFGTKILAMLPSGVQDMVFPRGCFPILDVRLNSLVFGPRPQIEMSEPIYVAVHRNGLVAVGSGTLPGPGEEDLGWRWYKLRKPPFVTQHVTSYAAHPDGWILFSVRSGDRDATFSLACFKWRHVGDWALPFTGRGHFDSNLNSFVGLSTDPETLGHLCSCAAISSNDICGGETCQAPTQRLSKETLFSEDRAKEEHLGATLVYMEDSACLVQGVEVKERYVDDPSVEEKGALHPASRHMFRLTKFSLKYDSNGDLIVGDISQFNTTKRLKLLWRF